MTLDNHTLEAMLADLESDRAERKRNFKSDETHEKVRQAVCAFANDLPGHNQPGVIFIGAEDDGSPSNLPITDQLLLTLSDIRSDGNILPLPAMTVEKRQLLGTEMAVITVLPADAPPVRYKGGTWIRVGPRRSTASAQEERILNERRRHRDLPFDLQPVSFAKLADLDRSTFESEYLPNAFSADVIAANHRTYQERLSACRMIDAAGSAIPTVLGCLVVGKRSRDLIPCAYIQFLRIDGTQLSDPITDEAAIDGQLGEVMARVDDKLKAHISIGVDLTSSNRERQHPDYPLAALQQLVRNAVMHRTYEATNAPVRVTWFSDRIEILSPGGPYGIVTTGNFGTAGITDYRNPNLAEGMKVLGYVQRFGVGIATARRLLADNGNPPPEFNPQPAHVLVTVRKSA